MKIIKTLAICAGLLLAVTTDLALARPGGGYSDHSGHSGYSGSSHFAGRGAYHGGGWGGNSGWHGGGGWRGGRWYGGGWYGGLYLDPWWYADAYPYYAYSGAIGYDAYPAAVVAPASPPVYVNQSGAAAAPSGDWYYCQNPAGYYPYVKSCSQAWERVPAKPPGAQ